MNTPERASRCPMAGIAGSPGGAAVSPAPVPAPAPAPAPAPGDAAFEVLDALGIARLARRSPTLDGAVPLRVAQACTPLLEGNAFGWQVVLTRPLGVRAGWPRAEAAFADPAELARRLHAAVPRLVAQGFLPPRSPWVARLAANAVWREGGRLRLWSGLLVRPRPGVWLRLSGCANRRNRRLTVAETYLTDAAAFAPLVIDLTIEGGEARVEGEIGCLAPVAPGLCVARVGLAQAPAAALAHVRFYDPAYFAEKKSEVTRKYRRLTRRLPPASAAGEARLVDAGPTRLGVEELDLSTGKIGRPKLARVRIDNAIGFRATYDGMTVEVTRDDAALARFAAEVEATWRAAMGEAFAHEHRRALWYLTKYFTPHPAGEPHFFVKPPAFLVTPPGWSTLLEGLSGEGYDVLRGVVATDVFHALPAVFVLHGWGGAGIRVPAGTPLLRATPVPRALIGAPLAEVTWRDARGVG